MNGEPREIPGDPSRTLLFVLRDELGLTGTKAACGEGECGACTVLADGVAIRACVTPLDAVRGRSLTTIEGLATNGAMHPVQQAFLAEGAFQCGYCTPGMASWRASDIAQVSAASPVLIVRSMTAAIRATAHL